MNQEEIEAMNSILSKPTETVPARGEVIDPTQTSEVGVNYDSNISPGPVATQRSSVSEDSWNTVNPYNIQLANPQTRYNHAVDAGPLEIDSPEFKAVYDNSNVGTQRAMLEATSTNHALKIAERRAIFEDSARAVEQDSIVSQVASGFLPAIMNPTTLLPLGPLLKGAQIAKTASKIRRIGTIGLIGGTVGAGINVADEVVFDAQGMPTNYMGAAGVGFGFGLGFGVLGAMLSGPNKSIVAKAIDPEQDSFMKDYTQDPTMTLELDVNGVPKLQFVEPQGLSIIDRIPWLGDKLRSDIHNYMQSENSALRSWGLRMARPTVSLKDAAGNVVPVAKTGVDFKRESLGHHNVLTEEITMSYGEAKTAGYTGNLEEFNQDIWSSYVAEMNKQRNEVYTQTHTASKDLEQQLNKDRKEEIAAIKEERIYYIDGEGKLQPVTEELIGTMPEDKLIYRKMPKKERDVVVDTINERYNEEIDLKNKELHDKFYDEYEVKFEGNEALVKGAESYNKYFTDMLSRSQKVGIKELQGIHSNKIYSPRTYNFKAIKTMDPIALKSELREGIVNDVRNKELTAKQVDESVNEIAEILSKSTFNLQYLNTSFMTKDLPLGKHLKQRKLYLNEAYMPNILMNNIGEVGSAYHYSMSGRQAVQFAFGTDNLSDISDMIYKAAQDSGEVITKAEQQAFDRTVQDLLGTLRMNQLADTPSWTFTRNLTSFNSARLGGGFGGNQFIELGSAILMNGTAAIVSGRIFKSLENTADILYAKNGKHDEFAQYLIGSGFMEDALHTSRINRYADTESGFNSGWMENKLNWMNDKLMKYNGMRYFMGVMEDYTGAAIVTQLKVGGIEAKRLSRWGLSEVDAASLGGKLKEVTKDGGWDLSSLSTKEQDQLQLAISRGIEEIVVQGDSIHLPAWLKTPGEFTKVLTQFMRFPLIAQEVLLRKGMKEEQAQMVAGTFGAITSYIGLKYLREQASISTGLINEIDSKYDYNNFQQDDWIRVTQEALNYTAPLGFMTSVYNYGQVALGNPELGRDWQSRNGMSSLVGPSGGAAEDLIQLMRSAYSDTGSITSERNIKRLQSLTPMMNLPLLKEGGSMLANEYGD